jgi:uncharacterized membrane protein YjjP (DUF1212 family)
MWETIAMNIGISFLMGAFGAGIFALSGYALVKLQDGTTRVDWRKFLSTVAIGGVGFVLVGYLGLDIDTVMNILAAAGIGAGGMKAAQIAILIGQKAQEKYQASKG